MSENDIFRSIGRDSKGFPKTVTSEEIMSVRYLGDIIIIVLYYGFIWVVVGRGLGALVNEMWEWEDKISLKRHRKRKFEDYHNYKYNPDEDGFGQP